MSVSTTTNSSILSNAKTYIIPVLIVVIGIMIAMGNTFSSQAAPVLPTAPSVTTTVAAPVVYHESSSASGGSLR